jgi:SulP family sulfate permease
VHAATLLLILVFAAPLARFIPLGILAAILFVVAYNMGEWREIPELLRLTKTDVTVWIVTFVLTVFTDLTIAVSVGMSLAALLFIRRVVDTTTVSPVTDEYVRDGHVHILQNKTIPSYVRIFRIHGPFLFGATDKLDVIYDHLASDHPNPLPEIVVLRLRNMTALDATGLRAFEELAAAMRQSGRCLLLCGAHYQPGRLIARADFHRHVGDRNICASLDAALLRAAEVHELNGGAPDGALAEIV